MTMLVVLLSMCAVCDSKKSIFTKNQKSSGLLSGLGLKTPLSKILLSDDILFYIVSYFVFILCRMFILILGMNTLIKDIKRMK